MKVRGWTGSMTDPEPQGLRRRTTPNIRDGMIAVVCIALAALLFKEDTKAPVLAPGPLGVDVETAAPQGRLVWGHAHRLMSDRREWSRKASPIILWYLLAGPTLAGPFIFWLHRDSSTCRYPLSGQKIWAILGLLLLVPILFQYGPIYLLGTKRLMALRLQSQGGFACLLWPILLLNLVFLFGTPLAAGWILTVLLTPILRRKMFGSAATWLDWWGPVLGCLWGFRNALYIYNFFAYNADFLELP
jgi:hypothetical protein